jgi:Domain of unkown function (DUF1775)
MVRWVARTGAAAAGLVIALALATTAYAHVEVEVSPALAGARNAVITFSAEAESPSAGIAKVQVFLPAGLPSNGITLDTGPAGWKLTPGTDNYTVAGPALAKGVNAVHSITVAQLPDTTKLVFKVLVTYANGSVDRWIEEPSPANPNPDHPAPTAQLSPGPAAATTPAASTAPVTTAPVTATASPAGGGGSGWWWLVAALAVLVAAGIAVLARRRRVTAGPG